ncbi:MAG TPA: acyltransferase [Cytophagaceae bacterium]|jgi:peptidoglycan/LPS O-acetylase OafA/YrhL|nr:acyltransferase [Cytophagaceae bacterium]
MKKENIYFENLDGLRFICFLFVFFYHAFGTELATLYNSPIYHFIKKDIFGNGNIGVNFFFVLSGFLITYLLIEEKKINGKVSLKLFWVRRALRIWPLYYFCVFFGFVIFPFFKAQFGQVPNETANYIYYLTFLNNFDFINKGLPDASILGVLWSIAIEEQFYLVWPIIVSVFPLKKLWIPFMIIILTSLIFRAINDSPLLNEYHTLSCIGDMTIGSIGAWLISISEKFKNRIQTLTKVQILSIYILFLFIFLFRDELLYINYGIRIFERMLVAIVIILIILEQNLSDNSLFKMSHFKRISKLGLITYGLYCFHFIGILVIDTLVKIFNINTNLWQLLFIVTPAALVLTIIISIISYKYYETPFLKLKKKLSFIKS